jgi:hypothetical protein
MDNTIDYNALLGEPPPPPDPTAQDSGGDPGQSQLPDAGFDPNQAPAPGDSQGEPSISAANQGQSGFAGLPATGDPIVDDAIAKSQSVARNQTQTPPSETAALNGAPGFSVGGTTPNPTASALGPQLPNPGPQLPNPGVGTSAPSAGGDRFVRDASGNITGVKSENGYYDSNFQSVRNMEDNYQRGDRMAGTVGGLQLLANSGNADAAAILGADKRTGSNFADSALAADWGKAHNAEDQASIAALGGKNQAAASNLQGQLVPVNATPGTTAQDFPMAQKIMDNLDKVPGVQPGSVSMDKYGNIVFQDQGGVRHIPANQWADWAPVIEQKIAAQNAPGATSSPPPAGNSRTSSPPPAGNSRTSAPQRPGASQPPQQEPTSPSITNPYGPGPTTNTPTGAVGNRNNLGTLSF